MSIPKKCQTCCRRSVTRVQNKFFYIFLFFISNYGDEKKGYWTPVWECPRRVGLGHGTDTSPLSKCLCFTQMEIQNLAHLKIGLPYQARETKKGQHQPHATSHCQAKMMTKVNNWYRNPLYFLQSLKPFIHKSFAKR